ncbi:hypothetical protein [Paenibacillus alvei]|nr:hypothetical protein [Paenibacillus alvei]
MKWVKDVKQQLHILLFFLNGRKTVHEMEWYNTETRMDSKTSQKQAGR